MNPTNDPHDDELRGWLRALRRAGEEKAPAFAQTWGAAKTRRQTASPSWRLAWAVATVAVVVVMAMIILPRPPKPKSVATAHLTPTPVNAMNHEPVPVAGVPEVSAEGLPTDFLLTTNNDDSVDRIAGEIDALLRP
jgi:hypothetical protein